MSLKDQTLQSAASLVLTYPSPIPGGKGLLESGADSSSTCGALPLCNWDASTSSLRTSQRSLFGSQGWTSFSGKLPKAGYMTVSGHVYQLKKLVLGTSETGGGRSVPGESPTSPGRYWPTPTVCGNHNRRELSAKAGDGLATAVARDAGQLWPTPVAWTDENREKWEKRKEEALAKKINGNGIGLPLGIAVQMWPTPRASEKDQGSKADGMADGLSSWQAQGRGATLSTAVKQDARRIWPTICAAQYRGCGPLGSKSYQHRLDRGYLDARVIEAEQASGKLNPDWVEALMGYPVGYTMPEGEPDHRLLDPSTWSDGSWEEGIPRLSATQEHRTKRLKALGNSVVPQVCFELFARLADHIIREDKNEPETL